MTASPVPRAVSSLSEVVAALRVGRHGRLERLRVVRGERPQRVLDAVAELGEHIGRDVLGDWVTKRPDAPDRMSRTVCWIASRKSLLASLNSRCASSKKTSLGLSGRPPGRSWKRSASSHAEGRSRTAGAVLDSGQLEDRDHPAPVGRGAQQVGVPYPGARVSPWSREGDELAEDDSAVAEEPAEGLEVPPARQRSGARPPPAGP